MQPPNPVTHATSEDSIWYNARKKKGGYY